jgi:hypothetical protein
VTDLGDQHVLAFMDVRSPDLLAQVSSLDELRAIWQDQTVDQTTLTALQQQLDKVGGLIVYQSKNQKTIGIRGTLSALTGLGAIPLDSKQDLRKQVNDALSTIGQGAGGAGAAAVALAGASAAGFEGVAEIFVVVASFVGFAAMGLVIGAGIAGLIAATAGQAEATVPAVNAPTADAGPGESDLMSGYQVFGAVPDNMSPELVDAIFQYVFGVDPPIPEPGQLPGAGDLVPGGDGGGFPGGEDTGGGIGGTGEV